MSYATPHRAVSPDCLRTFLMRPRAFGILIPLAVMLLAPAPARAQAVDSSLSFFITGRSLGTGGNLGGLAGADAHCQLLADSVGAGGKVWRAYLSVQASGGNPAVNARDRIGAGPWFNANKVMIAANVAALHDTANRTTISAANGLTHRGATVPNNQHDIVTGTKLTGMAPAAGADSTCAGWTSNTTGGALVGHHNRSGISSNICQSCWNESHRTNGCTQANLQQGGGAGYFYCFAVAEPTGLIPRGLPGSLRDASGMRVPAPFLLTSGLRAEDVVYRFELARATRVEVAVHDLEGRQRAVPLRGLAAAGAHAVRWDGRDHAGAPLPAGLYLIVMRMVE